MTFSGTLLKTSPFTKKNLSPDQVDLRGVVCFGQIDRYLRRAGPGRMPEEKLRAAEAEYLKYRHAYNSAAALVEALKTKPAV